MMRRSLAIRLSLLLIIPIIYYLHQREELRLPEFSSIALTSSAGLFQKGVLQTPLQNNLVAQREGVSRGPWIIDPPLPAQLPTKPFTVTFKCLWHAEDLCPKRYIVLLRGPTIYAPPLEAIKQDPLDKSLVSVELEVQEPGSYVLYAWPDFEACPKHWRDNMKYPFNRGQVLGTPTQIDVIGNPSIVDSMDPCKIDGPEAQGPSHGRWISMGALHGQYRASQWARSFPADQDYIYQPYSCKRAYHTAKLLNESTQVTNMLFLGDSVLRGAFCSQIWPQLSPSGKADGSCTFINDAALYHTAPKDMQFQTADGRKIGLSFRFMDDHPNERIAGLKGSVLEPSHIITNLGLWLAPFTTDQYRNIVTEFLTRLYEMYPTATVIWRTTTDVAPMIQCFSDKGMTRETTHSQREVSFQIVEQMKAKGMRLYVVDAYAITAPRPDSGNDGRHWVIESPEEYNWLPAARPSANQAERAILSAVWDIIGQDDRKRAHQFGGTKSVVQPI
ncbi:hypothetical protein FN846DRAFT_721991 [Sphaerosporella brunnea]|uniref:SGNH hydrolase-type esterase domain-containing protein n=1 Tax=Sphaerosporella brunnea TaxID=1250544 RepID=A0A5J5EWV5_9PEZI|nr:hypothetical protein FN846DRAFT_721991 [Sphaerosporella brunnea]